MLVALERFATCALADWAEVELSRVPAFRFVVQTLQNHGLVGEEGGHAPGALFALGPTQDFLAWLQEQGGDVGRRQR